MPDLSVVVPYGGIGDASLTLASLAVQTLPRSRFEIILVHETVLSGQVQRAARELSVNLLRWSRPPGFVGHSAGRMRNAAARLARSRRLVFIDADCIVGPGTLAIHAGASDDPAIVICGGVRELPATFPADSIRQTRYEDLRRHASFDSRLKRDPAIRRPARWLELYSGNASVPRALFRRVGGFDEGGLRCHDTDLGYRLSRRHARLVYAADADVVHIEHPRVANSRLEQAAGWRNLARKHPELREIAEAHIGHAVHLWRESLVMAEERFAQMTAVLPGRLFGTMWLLPYGYSEEATIAALGTTPYYARDVPGGTEYYVRMNRNCWDFSLVRPKPVAPEVSVVIPVRNGARTIERALASVFTQTRQNFEVIVIDDGSDDDTARIVANFLDDVRLRIVSMDRNRGMCHSLNAALDVASAPLLLQLDADDWLEPNVLALMCEVFADDPECGAAYCDAVIHQADGGIAAGRGTPATTRREILACRFRQVARTYRRDLLNRCGGWPTNDPFGGRGYYEDRLMLARVSEMARVIHVPKPLYHSSESPHSLSRQSKAAVMKFIVLQSEAMRDGMSVETRPGPRALACQWVPRRAARVEPWSVIVPSYGRPELLRLSLLTWLSSDLAKSGGEIIVVDDGSPEPLRDKAGVDDERIRFIRTEVRHGAPAARNRGATAARHKWLFFSDGDHLVMPDILAVHAWYHGRGEHALVTGAAFGARTVTVAEGGSLPGEWQRRLLDLLRHSPRFEEVASLLALRRKLSFIPDEADGPAIWREAWRTAFYEEWLAPWAKPMLDGTFDLTDVPHAWLRVGAANLSMSRTTFASLGGFDERMPTFEDWDIGARILQQGGRILVNSDAESLHQAHPRDGFRRQNGWKSARRFAYKHPRLIAALRASKRGDLPPGGAYLLDRIDEPRPEPASMSPNRSPERFAVLTFDDGPHPVVTPAVLDVLREYGATGTFFVNGMEVARSPEVVRRAVAEGHEIGVHGWSHELPSSLGAVALRESLRRTVDIVEQTTGRRPRWARAAYGEFTTAFQQAADALGLECVGWDIGGHDWAAHHSTAVIKTLAMQGIAGRILLLHDGSAAPEVLRETVRWICSTCRLFGLALPGLSALRNVTRSSPTT